MTHQEVLNDRPRDMERREILAKIAKIIAKIQKIMAKISQIMAII